MVSNELPHPYTTKFGKLLFHIPARKGPGYFFNGLVAHEIMYHPRIDRMGMTTREMNGDGRVLNVSFRTWGWRTPSKPAYESMATSCKRLAVDGQVVLNFSRRNVFPGLLIKEGHVAVRVVFRGGLGKQESIRVVAVQEMKRLTFANMSSQRNRNFQKPRSPPCLSPFREGYEYGLAWWCTLSGPWGWYRRGPEARISQPLPSFELEGCIQRH